MKQLFERRAVELFEMVPIPSFQELHGLFPVTTESADDINCILGKSWNQVKDAGFWNEHYSIPGWLSPKGLKYYLPAIIISAIQEYEITGDSSTAVDFVVSIMELYTDEDWAIYTETQQEFIFEWIERLNLTFC